MSKIELFTIGFSKKTAEEFFDRLRKAGVKNVIDIRLKNTSHLAGFTKHENLPYFLREIISCSYKHMPILAPTAEILNGYKKREIDWSEYERRFSELIRKRRIEEEVSREDIDHACLLCSESTSVKCHRRLVAEYLQEKLGGIQIVHL